EVAHVLEDSGARAVVAGADWVNVVAEAEGPARDGRLLVAIYADQPEGFASYEDLLGSAPGHEPDDQIRGGVMFYTSGTSGRPKGVRGGLAGIGGPVEIWQLVSTSICNTVELAEVDPVQLVCGPIYHSAQWVFAAMPLAVG